MTRSVDMQHVLEMFRAMEPVPDVLKALRTAAGGDESAWLSVAFQVRLGVCRRLSASAGDCQLGV